jgi:basic membrane lipoprotein Med (substrate-binding protein (PBP1-ABC) superfamily)
VKFVDRGVKMAVADAIAGEWQSGERSLGLAQSAVGLSPVRWLSPEHSVQLEDLIRLLAAGTLNTGA